MNITKKKLLIAGTTVAIIIIVVVAVVCCNSNRHKAQPRLTADDIATIVRQESKLYSAEQTAHKTVSFSTKEVITIFGHNIDIPWSGTTARIPITVTYKACLDLSQLSADNITIGADSTITITLPSPTIEMTSCEIDHDNAEFDQQLFAKAKSQEYINKKVSDAEQGVWADVSLTSKNTLIESSRVNAGRIIASLLLKAGYSKVNVRYEPAMNVNSLKVDIPSGINDNIIRE